LLKQEAVRQAAAARRVRERQQDSASKAALERGVRERL